MFNILRVSTMPLLALTFPLSAWSQTGTARSGYWHSGWELGWGHMATGGFMMIAFWSGVILLVYLAAKWICGSAPQSTTPLEKSAVEILNERFAQGEIEQDEYQNRKKILSN